MITLILEGRFIMGEEHWHGVGFSLIFNMSGAFIKTSIHAHFNYRG